MRERDVYTYISLQNCSLVYLYPDVVDITDNQGNFKGESVVAAILPSRMEVSYCTSRFFIAKPHQAILLSVGCLSRMD